MNEEIITGIDIGTSSIKIVVAESKTENQQPRILHATESPSHGFRHGYVTDSDLAAQSLATAIKKIEAISKFKIESARFAIGGVGLDSHYIKTTLDISKRDSEIGQEHIAGIIEKAEELFIKKYPNKKILHLVPVRFNVDGRDVLGNPIGMYGTQLQARIIFITILEHHYEALADIIKKNDIIIDDIVALPVADSRASLGYQQKSQGVILTNIGSETSSLASFENGTLTSLKILPLGSNDISNDLALGLQISLEEAEKIKKQRNKEYPKKKFDEIVSARLFDIFELTEKHLKEIKKNRLLPAGNVFSGGGSRIELLEDHAKKFLKLPAQTTTITKTSQKTKRTSNIGPQYSVAYGLCFSEKSYQGKTKKITLKSIKRSFSNFLDQIKP